MTASHNSAGSGGNTPAAGGEQLLVHPGIHHGVCTVLYKADERRNNLTIEDTDPRKKENPQILRKIMIQHTEYDDSYLRRTSVRNQNGVSCWCLDHEGDPVLTLTVFSNVANGILFVDTGHIASSLPPTNRNPAVSYCHLCVSPLSRNPFSLLRTHVRLQRLHPLLIIPTITCVPQ